MESFAQRLIAWQHKHGRHDLPWQGGDAYRVWLSEIMLQQTQVATVIPYFQRFISSFPDVASLAAASVDEVLAHWSGLGYYARGRNLHKAAQIIMQQHAGKFPDRVQLIQELPGVGRSTAAAVAALAFHQHHAILDGNVKRVLARWKGIAGWPGEKKVEAELWQLAESLLPRFDNAEKETDENSTPILPFLHCASASQRTRTCKQVPLQGGRNVEHAATLPPPPARGRDGVGVVTQQITGPSFIAIYTQALMDLGATVCTRGRPSCEKCPVNADCIAKAQDRISELPAPRPRKAIPEKHATFLLLMHGNDILLQKRPPQGIWGGLWCPPQLDDGHGVVEDYLAMHRLNVSERSELAEFSHAFTHFKLHLTPVVLRVQGKAGQVEQPGSMWLGVEDALQAAIPTPVRKMLEQLSSGKLEC